MVSYHVRYTMKNKVTMNSRFLYLSSIFIMGLVVSNVIAAKIISIGYFIFPASVLAYSITFLMTDVIGDVWGKKWARRVVYAGFVSSLIMIGLIYLSIVSPSAEIWKNQEAYNKIIGLSPRITLASLIAYLCSQMNDLWIFHLLKDKTGREKLWLRNNVSTSISQLIDQTLFVSLAFGGIIPFPSLVTMIFSGYLIKLMIALLDTPFAYAIRWFVERPSPDDELLL